MINNVIIIGRLTRDAELSYTKSGTAISKFSIAYSRKYKSDGQQKEETSFFDCIMWGKMAESLNQYLKKGDKIGVGGELKQDRWEKDGKTHSKISINVSNIELLGGNKQSQQPLAVATSEFENDFPY